MQFSETVSPPQVFSTEMKATVFTFYSNEIKLILMNNYSCFCKLKSKIVNCPSESLTDAADTERAGAGSAGESAGWKKNKKNKSHCSPEREGLPFLYACVLFTHKHTHKHTTHPVKT